MKGFYYEVCIRRIAVLKTNNCSTSYALVGSFKLCNLITKEESEASASSSIENNVYRKHSWSDK